MLTLLLRGSATSGASSMALPDSRPSLVVAWNAGLVGGGSRGEAFLSSLQSLENRLGPRRLDDRRSS